MLGAPWPEQSFNIQEGVPNGLPHPHMGLDISLSLALLGVGRQWPVVTAAMGHRSAPEVPSAPRQAGAAPDPVNVPGHAHSGSPNPTYWVILMWQGLLNVQSLPVHSRSADGRVACVYVIRPPVRPITAQKRTHHLVSKQQDSFETEFPGAEVEEVFQAWSQQLHHHHVVVALRPAPPDGGDAHCKRPRASARAGLGSEGPAMLNPHHTDAFLLTRARRAAVRNDTR